MSKEHSSVQGKKKKLTLIDKLVHLPLTLILIGTVVYGISHVVLSGTINRAFNHPQQCTITAAVAQRSGSKSYSSSSNIYIQSPDCSDLRFIGKNEGHTDQEIVDRIRGFKGQKVTVYVGVWQTPFSATDVAGIEGLDLSH
ncbi:hypothetical protein [Rothia terrae]|uniref:Uncharacterized protein n=1 Tax=Rothia terrae TaxID=396015 RepID=A0A7S6WW79_9MICC|nr:hypothetical protein [Rothia terrae]QOW64673.1 hypothetical protein IDM49_11675 [Rothia terrae]QOW64734.1 hypothetical protein IDM49_11850 [Rothia terrae]